LFFALSKRNELVKINPNAKITDISKIVSIYWKSLSLNQKKEFILLAEKDKARYLRECSEL